MLTHGHSRIGNVTREYLVWKSMKSRCLNTKNTQFKDYGGRGITVCDKWRNSFEAFLEDMGLCPDGLMMDRIDNNKGYWPGNCRWTDKLTQQNNRRSNRVLVVNGESRTMRQWSRRTGVNKQTIKGRLERGWPVESAVLIPATSKQFRLTELARLRGMVEEAPKK